MLSMICTPVAAPVHYINRPGLIGVCRAASIVKINHFPIVSSPLFYKSRSCFVEAFAQICPVDIIISGAANFDAPDLGMQVISNSGHEL